MKKRFRNSIIPAVAFAAHPLDKTISLEKVTKICTGILNFLVALHQSHHIENSLTKLGTPRHMNLSVFRLSVYNKEEEVDFVLEKMPATIESLRKNVTFLEGVTK